jgi:2-O-(6-phospho-alpha-D-mannosyl)-D-glycerate hydrolase
MELKHDLHVIALTHWDREWRFPFQKTRMMLVEMMDGLLDLLETDPAYTSYHLDGHTIMLEDYCEIRPENKGRIRKLVEAKRLFIGPWYTLPEENQLAGESLVRNLMFGEKVGREFGGCMNVGYSPTSWGQVSQMPQIFAGFDVKSAIFYRGISADQVAGNFYIWESPDGTGVFSVRLGDLARSAFFHRLCRPVIHNRFSGDSSHQWDRGGKPFRICGTSTVQPYYFCDPPMGWYPENLEEALRGFDDDEIGPNYELPFALAMECDDSTGPFPETPRLVDAMNEVATGEHKSAMGNLPDFVDRAMAELDPADLPHLRGEMRNLQRAGVWTDLYPEVQASRMHLKYLNRQIEYKLQRYAEPFAALAATLGADYPVRFLELAWKMLLANHAHDAFGGCGMDAVHYETEFRARQVGIIADHILQDAVMSVISRIDTSGLDANDVVLYVFNPLAVPRSGVVDVELDFDQAREVTSVSVTDMDGVATTAQLFDKQELLIPFQHPNELPCRLRADRWRAAVAVDDIPAFGYKCYVVRAADAAAKTGTGSSEASETSGDGGPPQAGRPVPAFAVTVGKRTLENEHLAVSVNDNGTFDITWKDGNVTYPGQNLFHDQGEVGDPWVGAFPEQDKIITSENCVAEVSVIEDGPLSGALEVKIVMDLPVGCSKDRKRRLDEAAPVAITSVIRLLRAEKFVRVATTIDNCVKDHIIRAFFPTSVAAATVQAETPFDVVTRDIEHPNTTGWREPYRPVQPMRAFVDISAEGRGFALLNAGNGQYEAVDSPKRELALTLLRCWRQWNGVRVAEYPDQKSSQCPGVHTFEYALYPHDGDWVEGGVMGQSRLFNLPMRTAVGGPGKGDLPAEQSFIAVDSPDIEIAAVKKGEWDDSLVLRLVNTTDADIATTLTLGVPVASAELCNMKEIDILGPLDCSDNVIAVDVPAKKILTVKLHLG